MSTNPADAALVYTANEMNVSNANLNKTFYQNFNPREANAILIDYNPVIHGIQRTEWDVETCLEQSEKQELRELMGEEFEENWDQETGIYSDTETLVDLYNMVEEALEHGVDIYTPDNLFRTSLAHIEEPRYPDKKAAQTTIRGSLFDFMERNTSTLPVSRAYGEVKRATKNGRHPQKRRPEEDRTLSKLARDVDAVVATYDTDFVNDPGLVEGFTPKQLTYMIRDQYEES